MAATPRHLLPENCYVCGGEKHPDAVNGKGHNFWSNADAEKEFNAAPQGHGVEAAYIATYRPY